MTSPCVLNKSIHNCLSRKYINIFCSITFFSSNFFPKLGYHVFDMRYIRYYVCFIRFSIWFPWKTFADLKIFWSRFPPFPPLLFSFFIFAPSSHPFIKALSPKRGLLQPPPPKIPVIRNSSQSGEAFPGQNLSPRVFGTQGGGHTGNTDSNVIDPQKKSHQEPNNPDKEIVVRKG